MPDDTNKNKIELIKAEYAKFLDKMNELRKKRLDILIFYRKKSDEKKIQKLSQEIESLRMGGK